MRGAGLGLRILGLAALLVFVGAAFTPVSNWLNAWMAGAARIEPADAIVVLGRGGADSDGVLTNRSLRRLMHGIELYRERLAPLLVLSGTGEETGARAVLAEGLGVPATVIMQVSSVHTTREEAERIGELLLPRGRRRIPTAATGPSLPEGRLGLLRDIATELGGLAYYRITGRL